MSFESFIVTGVFFFSFCYVFDRFSICLGHFIIPNYLEYSVDMVSLVITSQLPYLSLTSRRQCVCVCFLFRLSAAASLSTDFVSSSLIFNRYRYLFSDIRFQSSSDFLLIFFMRLKRLFAYRTLFSGLLALGITGCSWSSSLP